MKFDPKHDGIDTSSLRDIQANFWPERDADFTDPKSYPEWFYASDVRQFARWRRMLVLQAFIAKAEEETRPVFWMRGWYRWHALKGRLAGALRNFIGDGLEH